MASAERRDRERGAPTPAGVDRVRPARRGAWSWAMEAASGRIAAVVLAAVVLFPYRSRSGIWDPYELDTADLARRIAIHAFGARGLELPGALNSMPTLTDLRMGELSFTSMALGFRAFGLHDWTGRLPLALWGLAGVLVIHELVSRLVDRKAGVYAAIALVTMPLYVMQARTMLGDIVTMAALAMAFSGLAGAMLDAGRARAAWAAVGALGLAAGYLSRGLIIGVAAPALGVGVAWLVLRLSAGPEPAKEGEAGSPGLGLADVAGAVALVIGLAAAAKGVHLLSHTAAADPLARGLGVALLKKPPVESTFDLTIRQLGHALFPWSALLPFAIGRLLRAPAGVRGEAQARETGLRVALLVTAAFAYAAFALLAPRAGALPWSGPALLAAALALAIRDLERGAPASPAVALGCALLGVVLYRDFILAPDKALSVFSVEKAVFPKSFEREAATAMAVVFAAFAALVAASWFEAQPRDVDRDLVAWARRRAAGYQAAALALSRVWSGNLVFALIVVEAALVGLGAMIFVGRLAGWTAVGRLPKNVADAGVNAWWALPIAAAVTPALLVAIRDGLCVVFDRARVPRAAATLAAGLLAGSILSFWYYPALAAQLSPKEVFESYARLRRSGEPLAVLGIRGRAAAYYHGGEVHSFPDVGRAFMWLTEQEYPGDPAGPAAPTPPGVRRWLIVKADDLPKLNSLYRKKTRHNLPVLDGRSSQILLASNQLGDARNESWIASIVLDEAPQLSHPVQAMFEDQLELLGWEVTDASGKPLPSVVPQTIYHLRTYFRVRRPIAGNWKMFIHIDGFQRRYNGDHAVLEGRYPMSLWQPGDIVVDDHLLQLEPNFTPGDYTVYVGFYSGDARFRVTSGTEQDNRVIAGPLRVR
ncbi:MAG: glycosyltransferase family 39 protein [Polyangiaceae bacterium]|nr:glycosyltransferase family 39 protein [Polyangiaceae bacterium]